MTGYTERPEPALDELIQAQAMDRRVAPRRPALDLDELLRRLNTSYRAPSNLLDEDRFWSVLNERCPRCKSWLTDEARCLTCGRHTGEE